MSCSPYCRRVNLWSFQLMTGLECGHKFCSVCWTEYLTTKIMDEGMGQTIACAAHACDILVDDQTVMCVPSGLAFLLLTVCIFISITW